MSAYLDDLVGDDYTSRYIGNDAAEAYKMQPFTPRVQGAEPAPWWQGLVMYGATRAIDNTFDRRRDDLRGNTGPGTFAGQNGSTYSQTGPVNAPPQRTQATYLAGLSPMLLAGLAVAAVGAFYLLRK